MRLDGVPEKIAKKVEQNYIAELVLAASLTVMFVSSYSIYTAQSSLDSFDKVSQDLNQVQQQVNSTEFNNTIQVLESVEGSGISEDFDLVVSDLLKAQESINDLNKIEEGLERSIIVYKWLNLFSFVGVLTGIGLLISKRKRAEKEEAARD